jgi:hypothetical protein
MARLAYGEFLLEAGRGEKALEQLNHAAASGYAEEVEEILAEADD